MRFVLLFRKVSVVRSSTTFDFIDLNMLDGVPRVFTGTDTARPPRCYDHTRLPSFSFFHTLFTWHILNPFNWRSLLHDRFNLSVLSLTTMTDPKTNVYQERVSSGAYTRLIDNVMAMKSRALVSSEYKRDFYQDSKKNVVTPPKGEGNPTPFKTWLFGEIAPRAAGTLHQASGNHYLGPVDRLITFGPTSLINSFRTILV